MSRLEPDELARLLTQAVEPVRPAPDGYQRIRAGIERRRRMRMPLYALAGVAAAAVFALVVLALRPTPGPHVVEPAPPFADSPSGTGPDGVLSPSPGVPQLGSAGGDDGGSTGGGPSAVRPLPQTPPSPGTTPTGTPSPDPTTTPTRTWSGSSAMPTPTRTPALDGDVDGDGTTDEIEMAGATELQVRMSRDGTVASVLTPPVATPLRYTVVDIDGDGFGEVVVRIGGAENSVERYLLLRLMSPDEITIVAGSDVRLVAGIDTEKGTAAGFRCAAGNIESYTGESTGSGGYSVVTQTWRLEGAELVRVNNHDETPEPSTDTTLFQPDCGDLGE